MISDRQSCNWVWPKFWSVTYHFKTSQWEVSKCSRVKELIIGLQLLNVDRIVKDDGLRLLDVAKGGDVKLHPAHVIRVTPDLELWSQFIPPSNSPWTGLGLSPPICLWPRRVNRMRNKFKSILCILLQTIYQQVLFIFSIFKRDLGSIVANLPRYWSNISLAFTMEETWKQIVFHSGWINGNDTREMKTDYLELADLSV